MGVIKNSHINNPYPDSIEDVLENIENELDHPEPEFRRPRKIKHRPPRPHPVGGVHLTSAKSGKKKKRVENSTFLLSLADPDETQELSIHDFIKPTVSVFSELFMKRDNIEIWNEFINCTQNNEDWFLENVGTNDNDNDEVQSAKYDLRCDNPAFVASECFQRIDGDLRFMLKKKHVPLGTMMYLENELVTFFINRPTSVYHCQIPNSFERLLIHALSQYMNLSSLSYDRTGVRWTRVRNKSTEFCLPAMLLSTFLEKRHNNTGP